jgi:hypothetical protein
VQGLIAAPKLPVDFTIDFAASCHGCQTTNNYFYFFDSEMIENLAKSIG